MSPWASVPRFCMEAQAVATPQCWQGDGLSMCIESHPSVFFFFFLNSTIKMQSNRDRHAYTADLLFFFRHGEVNDVFQKMSRWEAE